MEINENTPSTPNPLAITDGMKDDLIEMSKWAKFLAILGFIGIGFIVLAAIIVFFVGMASRYSSFGSGGGIIALVYIILAVIYYFPVNYLYQASRGIKEAMLYDNKTELEIGIENLKSHYKFMGIFAIVIISLYILILFFGLIVAAAF